VSISSPFNLGLQSEKGEISFQTLNKPLAAMLHGVPKGHDNFARNWRYNLSGKRFRTTFGDAVANDPGLAPNCWEWRRDVLRNGTVEDIFCNPEDVQRTSFCRHNDRTVCSKCRIPICHDCWELAAADLPIPRALCNDNYIGYLHSFFIEARVTWIEATIACPIFTGLITYYIEGAPDERHHLMKEIVAKPQRAYGIRGNLFSFLLPWERIHEEIEKTVERGDLSEWPLAPDKLQQLIRVRLVKGPEELLNKFSELKVRAAVVLKVAKIYISCHMQALQDRPGIRLIHQREGRATMQASLEAHAERRIQQFYPRDKYPDTEGAVIPELQAMVAAQQEFDASHTAESAFEDKQATMPDVTEKAEDCFRCSRPTCVLGEGTTEQGLPDDVVLNYTFGAIADMKVTMKHDFEDQFVSRYMSLVFPWALPHTCGGPEYPGLFTDWSALRQCGATALEHGIQQRWRRLAGEAVLTPGLYAQMLSRRPEMQIGADWMLVPASRNLHWRYSVLHSAFAVCKQKVAPGEALNKNLIDLIEAARAIWQKLQKDRVTIGGKSCPLNGDVSLLFKADNVSSAERILLRSYLNVTHNIAGCQAIRRRIGHCIFGMRIVHGDGAFFTISPNRRWSTLLLKLHRARPHDTSLQGDDSLTAGRLRFAGADAPPIFFDGEVDNAMDVEEAEATLNLMPLADRLALNAQDPLSSVQLYLVAASYCLRYLDCVCVFAARIAMWIRTIQVIKWILAQRIVSVMPVKTYLARTPSL